MTTYAWSGPGGWAENVQNPTINNITTTQAGIYSLTVTDVNGCTGTTNIDVIVNSLPNADAGSDVAICEGSSTILSATGGISYEWSTNEYTPSITVTPTSTTTYYVTVYDNNGCSSTDAVIVTVNSLPIAYAGEDQTICLGGSINLTATGGISYLWSTNENNQTIQVSPATSTLYGVTVTDANGCSSSDAVFVSVLPLPAVNAGVDQEVCEGTEVILNATGALTYVWSDGIQNNVGFYPPVGTNTYTVTGTDVNGCSATDEVVVIVHPKPVANAGPDVHLCKGESATLTATGGDSYLWNTGQNTSSIVINPLITTTYVVNVWNTFGCVNSDTVEVIVHEPPIASAGSDVTICEGQSATLMAEGGIAYEWGTGEQTQSIVVAPQTTTLYYVTVTDANNCTAVANVTVIVNPLPQVQLMTTNADCGMTNGAIEAMVTGGSGNYTYQWDSNAGNATTAFVNNLSAGIYFVTVDDGYCPVVESAEVLENNAPVLTLQATATEICEGETVTLTVSGADTYIWTPSTFLSDTTGSVVTATPTNSITYTVTGYSGNCSATETIDITVNLLPHAYFAVSNIGSGEYEFVDMSQNATNWYWDFGDGNNSTDQNTTHTYLSDGNYTVMFIASNNCGSDTATQTITVIISEIISTSAQSYVIAYPNPNNGLFNIITQSNYTGIVNMDIYDVSGKKVYNSEIEKIHLKQVIPVNLKILSKGMYRIVFKEGNDIKQVTIVVDRY
jgi:PKD repeat protein